MTKTMAALAAALAAFALNAHAADKPMNPAQERMVACNKDAADKKGDERKAFMKTCLAEKKMTQQDRMVACNKDAAGKKGDERKAFMSTCLKG